MMQNPSVFVAEWQIRGNISFAKDDSGRGKNSYLSVDLNKKIRDFPD